MKQTLLFILLSIAYLNGVAQQITISGKVTDGAGKPVPFASIYIKNTTKGASANIEGDYSLQVQSGQYELRYKAVGYKQESRTLDIKTSQVVNITLSSEVYELNSVSINAKGEDPAYAIIRKTIKKRKAHLSEVKAYTAEVYIKGLQKLLAAPKKFMGADINQLGREIGLDSNRRGIVYLSESESKISYQYPGQLREDMISSKFSGSNRMFSFNRASDSKVNFYENYQNWDGLSNRPLMSPVGDNALFYYRYKLLGKSTENGVVINKIRVTPRRLHDACFDGFIYIIEDSWRIYALDLYITSRANINFVDTVKINQQFLPVDKVWMQSSNKFEFTGGLLGFKLKGYFISVYKDYDLNPTFKKGEFNEILHIPQKVNKNDTAFWNKERPLPLTQEEKTDYQKKEKLALKRESKTYLDSLDKATNKVTAAGILLTGTNVINRYQRAFYHFDPVLGSLLFSTVEGVTINYGAYFRKRYDSVTNKSIGFGANVRYGFSDHLFNGNVNASLPVGSFNLGLNAGSDVVDLNNHAPISPLINSLYSFLWRQNFEKLYQKQFASASLSGRITGGWQATASIEWANRKWLPNTNSFSVFHPKDHEFTSNNPLTPDVDVPLFPENKSLKLTVRTTYDFSNKYETYPFGRRYLPSNYPTIGLTYVKGIKNVLGSDVDYDLITADISKSDISMGVYGRTSFFIGAGKFLNTNSLYFPDYKQFNGNQVFLYKSGISSFLLLDYYRFSTYTKYIEGHLEHNFSGFITNKIPVIRNFKLQEIVDFNYLATPELKNYYELGFGFQYLGFRILYGHSYNSDTNVKSALRVGFKF